MRLISEKLRSQMVVILTQAAARTAKPAWLPALRRLV